MISGETMAELQLTRISDALWRVTILMELVEGFDEIKGILMAAKRASPTGPPPTVTTS